MDAIEIMYRLKRLGVSQAQIGRDLGVGQGVVSNVIHDRATAHSIALHIAKLLGCEVTDLWPERYSFKPRKPSQVRNGETKLLQVGKVKTPE
jgi:Ner family transcriptional regulator